MEWIEFCNSKQMKHVNFLELNKTSYSHEKRYFNISLLFLQPLQNNLPISVRTHSLSHNNLSIILWIVFPAGNMNWSKEQWNHHHYTANHEYLKITIRIQNEVSYLSYKSVLLCMLIFFHFLRLLEHRYLI